MSVATPLPESLPDSGQPGPPAFRRHPAFRFFYYTVCVLITVLIIALWWLYAIARSPLPQLDGSITISGISSKVRVLRDERGIPTIEAAALTDLFFAQGYVTAQDRLWQMDILRRAAAGELSEIIGPATFKLDREQRILGLRVYAEAAEKKISQSERPFFEAYARGVNAFIDSHRDRLSLEFRLMKYSPRPWTVTDSLLIGARMVEDLNHRQDQPPLAREKILAKLGPELTADLYVNSSWRDRPPTETRRIEENPSPNPTDKDDDDEDEEVDPENAPKHMISTAGFSGANASDSPLAALPSLLAAAFPSASASFWTSALAPDPRDATTNDGPDAFLPGSNNWVVSGTHTVSGKPLLSNDMHLDQQMPNLWFAAHLRSTNASDHFDVAGVTLPGVPFVIVGHNQRIGWGFTNVGPTVEDDYIEDFNSQGQYKTPKGFVAPEHRAETIHVKGEADSIVDVVTTRHGPIITQLIPGETRKIALRWTLQDGVGLVFFDVDTAQNWDEFRKAFSNFGAPGQNVMYADIDGHIGYQATGHIPIRASGDGSLPEDGSDDSHEWTGWIPFDDMPHVFDPAVGILATANGRITPSDYKYSISTEWEAPWRTDRIYRVLESGKKFAPLDMLALQFDVKSTFDRFCADKFVYAIDHASKVSDRAKRAAQILRDWDGRMSANSAAPTIETKARAELTRLILEPKLGAPDPGPNRGYLSWKSYHWEMSSVWLENVLTRQPARWLPSNYPDYDSLLVAALENVVRQGGAPVENGDDHPRAPADLSQWTWGKDYPVDIEHPVLSKLPLIGRFTGPGLHPLSGSHFTVKAVGRHFGPSERITWNFADFDHSALNLVTGESGVFLSPYYLDQWKAWYEGSTFEFPFSDRAIAEHRKHELTLEP
jgi:penicillin G amidase